MKQFLGFLSVVLVSMVAVGSAYAEDKTGRKKIEVDFFWTSNLATTTGMSDLDRSLNLGRDPFRIFADYGKEWQGPYGWGGGAGTRENEAEIYLWGTRNSGHRSGETHDLFNQRAVSTNQSGVAFGLNLRVATGDKWRVTLGSSQGKKTSIREDTFRDYMTIDNFTTESLWCDQAFCYYPHYIDLTTLYLSRHYRTMASTRTIRAHTISVGAERELFNGKSLNASLTGGVDLLVYHITHETTVSDYDYTRFYPEGIWLNETYSGHLADYRTEAGSHQSKDSNFRVHPRPYLDVAVGVSVCRSFGLYSQARWYPLAKDLSVSHDSLLGSYDTLTRPEHFTLTAGATLAF